MTFLRGSTFGGGGGSTFGFGGGAAVAVAFAPCPASEENARTKFLLINNDNFLIFSSEIHSNALSKIVYKNGDCVKCS
jgi:hypothetical protein